MPMCAACCDIYERVTSLRRNRFSHRSRMPKRLRPVAQTGWN